MSVKLKDIKRCEECSNYPKGETCICINCGNQYFDKWNCCICEEPCEEFEKMQERAKVQCASELI